MYLSLIQNVSLLIALITLYSLVFRIRKAGEWWVKIFMGLLFAAVTITGMRLPFNYATGVIYDGRSIVLSIAGLFGGGITAFVSILLAGAYRLYLGGNGVWAGLATIVTSAMVGLAFRRHSGNHPEKLGIPTLYLHGLIVHVFMLSCQLLVKPWPAGITVVGNIWLPILLIFPLATVLVGYLLGIESRRILAEGKLKKSEALYHDLVESSQDLVWQCDGEGRYTYLNPAWEQVFGYTTREMLGKKITDFQTPEYAERDLKEFARLIKGDTVKGLETVHIGKEGREIHLVFNAVFLVDEQGKAAGTRGTAYDITARVQAEEGLRESEQRYQTLAEISPVGIFRTDRDGSTLYVNPKWCAISGLSPEEALGDGWLNAVHPEDRQGLINRWQDTTRQQRESYSDYRFLHPDGSIAWVMGQAVPVVDPGNRVAGYIGTITDITERKQVEAEIRLRSEELSALLHSSQQLATTLDLERVLQTTTDAITGQVGLQSAAIYLLEEETLRLSATSPALPAQFPEEMRTTSLADHPHIWKTIKTGQPVFLPDTAAAELTPAERAISDARALRSVLYLPLISGAEVVGTLIVALTGETRVMSDSEIDSCRTLANLAALAIEKARLFESLQLHAAELETRVAERTAELQAANKELETFTYSVSHDLKAPLRGIDGYSRLLLEEYAGKLDEEGRQFLLNVSHAANQMNDLIDDLLTYSRLERRELAHGILNPRALIEAILGERSDEIKARRVKVKVKIPFESISADAEGLTQALRNLIDNALKFTSNVPQPAIEITGRKKENKIIIEVHDNGAGFDMQYKEHIFDIFQRLHRAEEYPGTGIGLAIVRKAVTRLGGRAWAESVPGKGATFYLEIPDEP